MSDGLILPKGAGAEQLVETPDMSEVPNQDTPDPDILERLSSIVTGENQLVEFPEAPELTEMGDDLPGFMDRTIPNLKALMTSDDLGKAEIFKNAFETDPRWGGAFVDKFGLPMIVWNKVPYYINKPGFTSQDFNSFLGEIVKYIPAARFVGKAKGIGESVVRAVPAYAVTETGTKIGEQLITPDTVATRDQDLTDVAQEVGTVTAIGVTADTLVPPAAKPIVEGAKTAARSVARKAGEIGEQIGESMFPRFDPAILQESKYPLTMGQRTAEIPMGPTPRSTEMTGIEDELRRAQDAGIGTFIIRGFDDAQLGEIRKDALDLQSELGANTIGADGLYANIPSAAAEQAQTIVTGRASQLKEESQELYENLRSISDPPMMNPEGVATISRQMLDELPRFGFSPGQIVDGPLSREVTRLRRLEKLAKNPKFKDQALSRLHDYQKSLNVSIRQAGPGTPEAGALIAMKQNLDDAIYNGIEQGFIKGNQEVLDQLKNATVLYRQYAGLTGKLSKANSNKVAANKILNSLSDKDYTPVQVVNLLFGHNKFAPNQAVPLVLSELQRSLPSSEYDQVVRLLKDGILTRAFSGAGGDITRTAIVKNYNDVFNNQRAIIDMLFSPDEIARIKQFRKDVMPTLWAEIKDNPSGTAYKVLSSLSRQQLLSFPSLPVRAVAPAIIKGVEEADAGRVAAEAVKQTLNRFQSPLFSGSAQAAIRPYAREEGEAEEALLELPEVERAKLNESLNNAQGSVQPEPVDEQAMAAPMPSVVDNMPVFEPLETGPQTSGVDALSSIVLPRDDDRELAMRLRARRSGIGGLV